MLKNGYSDANSKAEGEEIQYTLSYEDYRAEMKVVGKQNECQPGIVPLDIAEPYGPAWILGGSFLSKFVSIYDRDNDVVGFAKAKLK